MFKRNTLQASILSGLALTMLCLCSSVANAQKGPVPIKGIDVKLGQNSGGTSAARTSTDENGNFTFPVLPKGEYTLTLSRPEEARKITDWVKNSYDKLASCYITLNLPEGKKVEMGYDLVQNKAFDPAIDPNKQSTSKARRLLPATFVSNGVTPLNGKIIASHNGTGITAGGNFRTIPPR